MSTTAASNVNQSVPSSVQASTNYEYVSTLDLTVGIHEPTVSKELVKRFGNQELLGLMDMIGNKEEVHSREFHHYEEDFIHSKVVVADHAAGSAGAAVTYTVSASTPDYNYDYATSAVSPYQQAGNYKTNPVRVNDIIQFSGGIQGFVTAVDYAAGTFTAFPEDTSVALPQVGTGFSSNEIIIISNAMEEASDARSSQNSRVVRYSNNLQIIRDNHTVTGSEKNVKMWFEVNGKSYWYVKGIEDTYKRFMNQIEMALVFNKKFTNTGITNYGTMTTTQGLLPSIESAGIESIYGTWALSDLDDVTAEMDKFRAPEENALFCGFNINKNIDDVLRSSDGLLAGGIIYSTVSEEKAVNFGFKSFTKNGYTFHKKAYKPFTHPELFGADGQDYTNTAFTVPLGSTVTSRDMSGTSETVPMLSCAYMTRRDGQTSYYDEWETGSLFGTPTNNLDSSEINFRADVGLWAKALNRYTIWKTA